MNRNEMLKTIAQDKLWDLIIIGGGATGLGIAVDAASRGFTTLLLEQQDFAKGTSSRSTKLIHGGLRYLQQGNLTLVSEALKERGLLCKNAPQLVHPLAFLVPNYKWWEGPLYGVGIKIYDLLAGKLNIEPSRHLSRQETLKEMPTIQKTGLRGSVLYYDGQFDDARLAITLAHTATHLGATLLNYMPVVSLVKKRGALQGLIATDTLHKTTYELRARIIINATGAFCDTIRKLDQTKTPRITAPSQGIHLVLPRRFMPSDSALLVPHTDDRRVLFFVPWYDHVLLGTTDTAVKDIKLDPKPLEEEIEFLLNYAQKYLTIPPKRSDVLSMFAGLRPLIKAGSSKTTATLSRDHSIIVSPSGLLTIAGGKWTTYRKMAEDAINKAIAMGKLPDRPCSTADLKLWGYKANIQINDPLAVYGSKATGLKKSLHHPLHKRLHYLKSQALFAIHEEMAETVEDILSRRTRSLFLDASAAMEIAPWVANLLAKEKGYSKEWQKKEIHTFNELAKTYLP
ncbi:MAG: glycerol-3-phosphate dehydrogenase/oxidase [Simkania sp.]|nr:glycerol-3-phosphate dehydrogenase/oxidase [Simkania sp.]